MKKEKSQTLEQFLSLILFLLLGISAFSFGFHLIDDWDFPMHLKTGAKILEQGPPKLDPYSFRTSGKKWIDAPWLFQLLIYLIYRGFGFPGLSWFLAFLILAIFMSIIWWVWHREVYYLIFPISLMVLWASSPRFYLRPELFSYLLMVAYLILLERDQKKRDRGIFLLPWFQLLWANLEGLWTLGLVIIGSYLIEELGFAYFFRSKFPLRNSLKNSLTPKPKRILALFIICLLVSFATPYHLKGFLFPFTLFQEIASPHNFIRSHIEELIPPFPYFRFPFLEIPFLVLILFSGFSLILNRTQPRISHGLLWLAFLFLSLSARRNITIFSLHCLLVLGTNFKIWFSSKAPSSQILKRIKIFSISFGMTLFFFLNLTILNGKFYEWDKSGRKLGAGFDFSRFPSSAVNFLKRIGWKGRLFNQLQMGEFLIAVQAPDWEIYVDGRLQLYGEELIEDYFKALKDYQFFCAEQAKYGFDAVLLDTRDLMVKRLIKNLLSDPGWAMVYLDENSVVFLKDTPKNHPLIEVYKLNH